jgi:hypothetical protein
MAHLEAEPADGTLERILVVIGRRRTRVTDPRVLAAAGSAGALVATVVVARVLRQRRHAQTAPTAAPWSRRLRLPGVPIPAAALARAK